MKTTAIVSMVAFAAAVQGGSVSDSWAQVEAHSNEMYDLTVSVGGLMKPDPLKPALEAMQLVLVTFLNAANYHETVDENFEDDENMNEIVDKVTGAYAEYFSGTHAEDKAKDVAGDFANVTKQWNRVVYTDINGLFLQFVAATPNITSIMKPGMALVSDITAIIKAIMGMLKSGERRALAAERLLEASTALDRALGEVVIEKDAKGADLMCKFDAPFARFVEFLAIATSNLGVRDVADLTNLVKSLKPENKIRQMALPILEALTEILTAANPVFNAEFLPFFQRVSAQFHSYCTKSRSLAEVDAAPKIDYAAFIKMLIEKLEQISEVLEKTLAGMDGKTILASFAQIESMIDSFLPKYATTVHEIAVAVANMIDDLKAFLPPLHDKALPAFKPIAMQLLVTLGDGKTESTLIQKLIKDMMAPVVPP